MRHIRAIATDYDETVAEIGFVPLKNLEAMRRLRKSGRLLILDTGRALEDLTAVFPELDRFDSVLVENGAILFDPKTGKQQYLADPIPESFRKELQRRGVSPLPKREVIVDTNASHAPAIRQAMEQAGLELNFVFNGESVLVLPRGVDKGFGLKAVLADTGISLQDVAAIGDGQNDLGLLDVCGVRVAVPNAIPELKARATHIMTFTELVDAILIQ